MIEIKDVTITLPKKIVFNSSIEKKYNFKKNQIFDKTGIIKRFVSADNDTLLIFDTSASALKKIQVSNVSPSKSSGTGTGDGSTTAFTINSGRSVNDVLVVVNGIVMVPTTDYQISGTTLTFQGSAPASGAEIVFRYLPV